jgi:hypothetical protein
MYTAKLIVFRSLHGSHSNILITNANSTPATSEHFSSGCQIFKSLMCALIRQTL